MRPGRDLAELAADHPRWAVLWATELLVVAAGGAVTHDARVAPYLTIVLLVSAVFAATHRAVHFSSGAVGMLVVLAGLHFAGGLLPDLSFPAGHRGVLYDTWLVHGVLRYDQAVHAFGSVAATYASWQVLGRYLDLARTPVVTQAVWAGLAGLGKGALNEIFEFVSTLTVPNTYVGDAANNQWDLVFDLLGCVCAGIWLVQAGVARRSPQPDEASDGDRLPVVVDL